MSDLRGHTFADLLAGLNAHQHLAVDAVVAFVDGELAPGARDRAAEHVATCQSCAAEVVGQRQARTVIRSAGNPRIPADLLAALRDIPQTADLPNTPGGLAVTDDGTVVTVADPGRTASATSSVPLSGSAPLSGSVPLSGAAPLGAGPRWGSGSSILGRSILGRRIGRAVARVPAPGSGSVPGDHGSAAR